MERPTSLSSPGRKGTTRTSTTSGRAICQRPGISGFRRMNIGRQHIPVVAFFIRGDIDIQQTESHHEHKSSNIVTNAGRSDEAEIVEINSESRCFSYEGEIVNRRSWVQVLPSTRKTAVLTPSVQGFSMSIAMHIVKSRPSAGVNVLISVLHENSGLSFSWEDQRCETSRRINSPDLWVML